MHTRLLTVKHRSHDNWVCSVLYKISREYNSCKVQKIIKHGFPPCFHCQTWFRDKIISSYFSLWTGIGNSAMKILNRKSSAEQLVICSEPLVRRIAVAKETSCPFWKDEAHTNGCDGKASFEVPKGGLPIAAISREPFQTEFMKELFFKEPFEVNAFIIQCLSFSYG